MGPILSQIWYMQFPGPNMHTLFDVCVLRFSIFTKFVSKLEPHWDPFRVCFWDWVLALFWNPRFPFFSENRSPKWHRNGVPFWDLGPSQNEINSSKISLFGALDGVPFLGPRSGPLKNRRGTIFEHFRGPRNLKKSIRVEFLGVSEGVLKIKHRPGLQQKIFCYYLLHLS